MISENSITKILQVILYTTFLVFIFFYQLPKILDKSSITQNTNFSYQEISSLFEMLGFVLSSFTLLVSIRLKWLTKIILKDEFIDGKYVGKSYFEYGENIQSEIFEIQQTLISTKIRGQSYKDGKFFASWQGKLVEIINNEYRFLLHTNTIRKTNSLDYLVLFIQNGECNGFSLTIESGVRTKTIIEAKIQA